MRIVLAVDGSASADRAVDLVAALPWRDGGRVRIVSVAPSAAELGGIPWTAAATAAAAEAEASELREHRRVLATAERELRSARCDLVIESVLLRGRAASAIVEAAREMPADLVVFAPANADLLASTGLTPPPAARIAARMGLAVVPLRAEELLAAIGKP